MAEKDFGSGEHKTAPTPTTSMEAILNGLAQHIESLLDRIDSDSPNHQVREIEGLLERISATEDYLEQWVAQERNSDGTAEE